MRTRLFLKSYFVFSFRSCYTFWPWPFIDTSCSFYCHQKPQAWPRTYFSYTKLQCHAQARLCSSVWDFRSGRTETPKLLYSFSKFHVLKMYLLNNSPILQSYQCIIICCVSDRYMFSHKSLLKRCR